MRCGVTTSTVWSWAAFALALTAWRWPGTGASALSLPFPYGRRAPHARHVATLLGHVGPNPVHSVFTSSRNSGTSAASTATTIATASALMPPTIPRTGTGRNRRYLPACAYASLTRPYKGDIVR